MKKEFKIDTRVKIINVGGDKMSKATGIILGKASTNIVDHYIVLLDKPLPEAKAVCITESCLEEIKP